MIGTKLTNEFLRTRKAKFKNFDSFKHSWLYDHYCSLFGPMVYTSNTSLRFIAVDAEGYFYDEFYYPYAGITKIGTILPVSLYRKSIQSTNPDKIWEEVANKGYAVIDKININESLVKQVQEDGYIPFGMNPDVDMSASIAQSFYAVQANYDKPEKHWNPEHISDVTRSVIDQMPQAQPMINEWALHTSDVVKYLYDPNDFSSSKGPYKFHADFFPRALCMMFLYLAKDENIVGRELLVGKRKDFGDGESFYNKLSDEDVEYDRVEIGHTRVILINTINPMFVHKVEKLRAENEITFVCSYLWSGEFR